MCITKWLECLFNAYLSSCSSLTLFPFSPNRLISTVQFAIFTGEGPDVVYKVVLQDKTWRQAQEYCRVNHTDLASVMSQTENQAIQQMITNNVPSLSLVWIGLFRDGWKWSDKSNSSFRSWTSSQPNDDGICTLYSPSVKKWYDRDCSNKHPFCCYIGEQLISVRSDSIKCSILVFL